MPTTPPTIAALPAPPDPNNRATFNALAYPWSVAQQTFGTQLGLVASNVYSNANDALNQANNAAASAVAATNNGAAQVALATTQANNAAASAVAATNNGAAQVALAAQAAAISAASANYKGPWAGLTGALNTPASVSHNNVFWALNYNLADVLSATPGLSAAWTQISGATIKRSTRTSNTVLGTADTSKLISLSGTFTQTFAAAAALTDGWFVYLQNSGTGDITLDPSGSELIDGLSGYIMYPGETRLIQCDGLTLSSIIIQAFTRTFTSSGTFTKPPGYLQFSGLLWAGGGGGAMNNNGVGSGGGGGACHPFLIPSASLSTTQSVIIGAGGAGATTSGASGAVGGTSTFGPINSYGGSGGYGPDNSYGGGGGGIMSAGSSSAGGKPSVYPQNNASVDNPGFGGGGIFYNGSSSFAGSSVYGGASSGVAAMGRSVYGGGAGGAAGGVGSSSVYGGAGGNASTTGAASPGAAPAGGGGHGRYTAGGAGGRGEMRIWGVM